MFRALLMVVWSAALLILAATMINNIVLQVAAAVAYLRTEWRSDFKANLPQPAEAYAGGDTSQGDFESVFKPKDTDMTSLSCQL